MIIDSLNIENFLTIGKAELNLNNRGLSLVQGENTSDPSASSNGAGKTSIAESVCWCLYGVTARGVKGDSVINNEAKKNCMVSMTIHSDEKVYSVTRFRKHKKGKNRLVLEQIGSYGKVTDLTKGTDKLTQEELSRIVGCSYEVFRSAVYLAQDGMPDLPAMTDKQLKEIIEEASGLTKLEAAHVIAKERHLKLEKKVDATLTLRDSSKSQLAAWEDNLKRLKERLKQSEDEVRKKIAELKVQRVLLETEREKIAPGAADAREGIARIDKKVADLDKALGEFSHQEERLEKLRSIRSDKDKLLTRAKCAYETAKNDAETSAKEIKEIESKVDTPCPGCGKLVCQEDIEGVKEATTRQVKAKIAVAKKARTVLLEADKEYQVAAFDVSEHEKSMPPVSEYVENRNELLKTAEEYEEIVSTETRIDKSIAEVDTKLKEEHERERKNPLKEEVALMEERLAAQKLELAALNDELAGYDERIEILKNVVGVFGRKGVRAHVLETVTPYLNERTAYYLGTLSDGTIVANWSTLAIKSDGELAEKFNILVSKEDGAKEYFGLSGGERRKVRLATSMALQDLVASRASKPINLFIADEIDDALDVSGLERLMGILEEKGRERGTLVLISHNDIGDWVRNVSKVTKSGYYSEISGYLSAG
jgi:DNA repair exonuclease SbcCD ATPase subunit